MAFDWFGKRELKTSADLHFFDAVSYLGAVLVLFVLLLFTGSFACSPFTVLAAVGFAVVNMAAQILNIKALRCGSMSYTTFISCCGFFIPALFGSLFYNEPVKPLQLLSLPLLILSLAFTMELKKGNFTKKWFIYAFGCMFFTGLIGVLQKFHQESSHKNELSMFLLISFGLMALSSAVIWRFSVAKEKPAAKQSIFDSRALFGLLSGLALGTVHHLNLYLSGVMPSVVFFPFVNGGLILLATVASVVFFHEKISVKQWVGLVVGIAIICLLGG